MASVSLRFLVELAAAQPPRGLRNPDASNIQRLWGLAEILLEIGTARDAAANSLEPIRLDRHGALLYLRAGDEFDAAMKAQGEAFRAARIDRLRGATNDMPQSRVFALVDKTLTNLLGLDARQFIEIMQRAQGISEEHGGCGMHRPAQQHRRGDHDAGHRSADGGAHPGLAEPRARSQLFT